MSTVVEVNLLVYSQKEPMYLHRINLKKSYVAKLTGIHSKFTFEREFMNIKLSDSKKCVIINDHVEIGEILEFKNEIRHNYYRKEYYVVSQLTDNYAYIDKKKVNTSLIELKVESYDVELLKSLVLLSKEKRLKVINVLLYFETLRQLVIHLPGGFDTKIRDYDPYLYLNVGHYDFLTQSLSKKTDRERIKLEQELKEGMRLVQLKGFKIPEKMKVDLRKIKLLRKSLWRDY